MVTRRLLVSLFVLCLALVECSALVPVIGWSNSDAFSSVNGNQFSGVNEFIYNAELDNVDTIVIFKSPELSFDGLTKYGGAYGGDSALASLQSEMKSSKSSVWAGVEGNVASDLVSTLSFILDVKPRIIAGSDGVVARKLLVVELTANPDGLEGLAEHDAVISEVMSAVHSLPGPLSYAAIYTSSHTHLSRPQHQEVRRSVRDTAHRTRRQANTGFQRKCAVFTTGDGNNSACLLFCVTNKTIALRNTTVEGKLPEPFTVHNITDVEITEGSCNQTDGKPKPYVKVTFYPTQGNPLIFTFKFPRGICKKSDGKIIVGTSSDIDCGFWSMDIYVGDASNGQKLTRFREEEKIFSQFSVAEGTAYACSGNNTLNKYTPSTNSSGLRLDYQFFGLQVQAYEGIVNNSDNVVRKGIYSFASVSNCQGYVTTVPLMGLVAVIILIIILYCSIVFLFSIRTLDRFDDPRAPTITVENLH